MRAGVSFKNLSYRDCRRLGGRTWGGGSGVSSRTYVFTRGGRKKEQDVKSGARRKEVATVRLVLGGGGDVLLSGGALAPARGARVCALCRRLSRIQ